MKRRGRARGAAPTWIAIFTAAGLLAAEISKSDADRMNQKIEAIRQNGAAARPEPRQVTFTEKEVNSYLAIYLKDRIPPAVSQPEILMPAEGRVLARALLDVDEFNRSRAPRGLWDPLQYLSGRVPVSAQGALRTAEGIGRFELHSAEALGVPLPKPLVAEIVAYLSRTRENPSGLDIDGPFKLPAEIREIRLARGYATVIQ
jgi:hypothetical protein